MEEAITPSVLRVQEEPHASQFIPDSLGDHGDATLIPIGVNVFRQQGEVEGCGLEGIDVTLRADRSSRQEGIVTDMGSDVDKHLPGLETVKEKACGFWLECLCGHRNDRTGLLSMIDLMTVDDHRIRDSAAQYLPGEHRE
jgi:hypothetical protein